ETLNASLWKTILQGFVIAMLGTGLAVFLAARQEKRYGINLTPILQDALTSLINQASRPEIQRRKVIEFIWLFVTLFGSILLIHSFFHFYLMLFFPNFIIVLTVAFYLYKRRPNRLRHVIYTYVKKDIPHQSYQLSIMLSVGVLIYALN